MKRQTRLYLALLLVMVLALAACGGDDEEEAPTAPPPTNTIQAEAVVPGDTPGTIGPNFVQISGDPLIDRTLTVNNWTAQQIDDFYVLLFTGNEDNLLVTIENIPPDIEPGTYEFAANERDENSDELFAFLQIDRNDVSTYYTRNVEGTLEISSVENGMLTGTFSFTATRAPAEDEASSEDTEPLVITVNGAFENIELP